MERCSFPPGGFTLARLQQRSPFLSCPAVENNRSQNLLVVDFDLLEELYSMERSSVG
jgi:hypothetical protein